MEHVFADRRGSAADAGSSAAHRLRKIGGWLGATWRYASARRKFERLDAVTLRDLGMSASEFDSYWAESEGLAEPTRLRVRAAERRTGNAI